MVCRSFILRTDIMIHAVLRAGDSHTVEQNIRISLTKQAELV